MRKVVIDTSYSSFCLSEKAEQMLNERKGISSCFCKTSEYLSRHDEDLVAVVTELGPEASGPYSQLEIVEVAGPYRICEYDRSEWVEEPHTINWID